MGNTSEIKLCDIYSNTEVDKVCDKIIEKFKSLQIPSIRLLTPEDPKNKNKYGGRYDTRRIKECLNEFCKSVKTQNNEQSGTWAVISDYDACEKGAFHKQNEWLFDFVFFTYNNGQDYTMRHLPIIMESEWRWYGNKNNDSDKNAKDEDPKDSKEKLYGGTKYSPVKFDFQKLLASNAKIKIMVFLLKKGHNLNDFCDTYFQKVINLYEEVDNKSKYIIIAYSKYSERRNEFQYKILEKSDDNDH